MTTLTDFLRARLDKDEWEAERALSTLTNEINHARLLNLTSTREEILAAPHLGAPIRRMFAEVEAKRQIVADPLLHVFSNQDRLSVAGERILRHLALPYADHPDYQEEWKPCS